MIYRIFWTVLQAYIRIFFKFRIVGVENVPKNGAAILCANHMSANDPISVAVPIYRPVHYMAKKELFKNKLFTWLLGQINAFPVDRSKNDMKAIKTALKCLKDGELMGIFAQGTRVGEGDAAAAKGGVALLAAKSGAPVIPVHITGQYKFRKAVTVIYGKPITLEQYAGQRLTTEVLGEIADNIMEQVMSLEETQ